MRFTRLILDHFDIGDCFDCIIGGDTVAARKPDPEPVLAALRELKGSATAAVMVGDSENDVKAGRGAGARTCAVAYGFCTAEQLRVSEPDVLIDRFDELKEFFC